MEGNAGRTRWELKCRQGWRIIAKVMLLDDTPRTASGGEGEMMISPRKRCRILLSVQLINKRELIVLKANC